MTIHIALLRAVNLGAHNRIAMPRLCEFFAQVGLANPRSLLQSGNVMFESTKRTARSLETLLETEARKRLALETDFFVRMAEEWQTIVAHNPFPEAAARDPGHLVVMCLKAAPDSASVKALQAGISGPELVHAVGRQAYITYPAGIGTSRLSNAVIERKLGTRGTSRNWNTVMKLGALASV